MILKIMAAELDAIAIGRAYAVLKIRIPGNARLHSTAPKSPSPMPPITTIRTKMAVTVRLFQKEADFNSSI